MLIRIPLSDIKNLESYKEFVSAFKNKNITLNILQDRANIEDHSLLKKNITLVFSTFKGLCTNFQIGNAINEKNWYFENIDEYLQFYNTVQDIRDEKFKEYKLIGSSIKGFEFKDTARTLFNYFKIKFDKVSSLLYVDKQGFPEKPVKFTFDLTKQINTLHALSTLAIKSNNDIIISEVSWHIKGQKNANEFAISEANYANYMIRYYLLALASKKVETVFWFQLVSTTFGLTYFIDEQIQKRKAFYAFKTMINFLENCIVENYSKAGGLHVLTVTNRSNKKLDIVWVEEEGHVELTEFNKVFDIYGNEMKDDIKISKSPIYAYH